MIRCFIFVVFMQTAVIVQAQDFGLSFGLKGMGVQGGFGVYEGNEIKLMAAGGVHFWWEGYGYKKMHKGPDFLLWSEVRERYAGYTAGLHVNYKGFAGGIGAEVMPEKLYKRSVFDEYIENGWRVRPGVYGMVGYEFIDGVIMRVEYSSERKWMVGVGVLG